MYLVLALDPSALTITPALGGGANPLLLEVGQLEVSAHVGETSDLGGRESSSVNVKLSNRGGRAVNIIGLPLRRRAEIFNADGTSFFAGYVSDMDLTGRETVTLTIGA